MDKIWIYAWKQRKLGTICRLITKGTTPKNKSGNGKINFVKVENINADSGEISDMTKITIEEHEGYLKRSRLEANDILFSIAGTLGRVSVVKPNILPANTNQALAIIRCKEGYIPYLTTVLKGRTVEDFIRKNPTIGAQPNLSLEQVKNLKILLPTIEEQMKIGDYFSKLDNLITFHHRKLNFLNKIYRNAWEQRKYGDVITEVSRPITMEDNEKYQLVTVKRRNEGLVSRGYFYGREILVKNYFEIRTGDYVISKRQLVHGANGQVPESLNKSIVSNEYMVCIGNDKITSSFLAIFSKTEKLKKDFFLSSYGIDIEKLVFNVGDWKKRGVFLPSVEEQNKISVYFNVLDRLITLHQQKCKQLQIIRKFMLKNMFL